MDIDMQVTAQYRGFTEKLSVHHHYIAGYNRASVFIVLLSVISPEPIVNHLDFTYSITPCFFHRKKNQTKSVA
jgi:hypothetical protein